MSLSVVCCHLLSIISGMHVLVGDFGLNIGRRNDFLRGVFIPSTLISSWLFRITPFFDVVPL